MASGPSPNGRTTPRPFDSDRVEDIRLQDVVNLVRRNLLLILGITAVIVLGTAWYAWTTPPIFQAEATLHVDADPSSGMGELDFLNSLARSGDVETEIALLRARSIAEEAVDRLSLQAQLLEPTGVSRAGLFSVIEAGRSTPDATYTFQRQPDGTYRVTDEDDEEVTRLARGEVELIGGLRLALTEVDPTPPGRSEFPEHIVLQSRSFYDAVRALSDNLTVSRPYRDANVIAVAAIGRDPRLVRDIPNTVVDIYIEKRRRDKRTEARSTVQFLREQIDLYTDRLRQAEENLLAFQQGEQVVNLQAEGAEQVRRLVEAQATKDQVEQSLGTLTALLQEIDEARRSDDQAASADAFRRLAGFPFFLQNQTVTEILTQLNDLEAQRTEMATRRTANHPDMVGLDQSILALEDRLYQLAVNYRGSLASQASALDDNLERFGGQLEELPEKAVQEARLERERDGLEELFTLLQSRLKEAEIAQAVEPGDVRVVDYAILPVRPIRPRRLNLLILSVLLGLVLGVSVAAARDYLDETVHSRDEVVRITNLPVLAMIPRIKGAQARKKFLQRERAVGDRLVTKRDVGNPVSEAYRAFRTNITFLDLDRPPRVLVLTSPGPSEGKSTSAANLAITLAQQGTRALLVDCDLRRGIVHRVFDAPKTPGVTDILLGTSTVDEAVHTVDVGEGGTLDFLATGTLPPNPSELLGSTRMKALLDRFRGEYDMVILDSPPLNLVTDAAVLGASADGVVLVARAGNTEKGALRYAQEQLEAVRAPISGVVLNDLDYSGRGKYYGSGYGYGYYYRYYRAEN